MVDLKWKNQCVGDLVATCLERTQPRRLGLFQPHHVSFDTNGNGRICSLDFSNYNGKLHNLV